MPRNVATQENRVWDLTQCYTRTTAPAY